MLRWRAFVSVRRGRQAYLVEKIIKDVPDDLDDINAIDADAEAVVGGAPGGAAPSTRVVIHGRE